MDNKITFTLNSPITEEQWDDITDVDFEHTDRIWFETKHGNRVEFVKASAQPEQTTKMEKQDIIRRIEDGIVATSAKDVYSYGMRNGMRWCKSLLDDKEPEYESAQPEVKPIDYRDCSCALLKMWIENVLTDSEYSRIQGKLNSSDFAKEGLRIPVPYQEEQNG